MAPVWTAVTGLPGQGVHSNSTVFEEKKKRKVPYWCFFSPHSMGSKHPLEFSEKRQILTRVSVSFTNWPK